MHQGIRVRAFLSQEARSSETQALRDAARYWLAVSIADRVAPESGRATEVQRAALYALIEATDQAPARLLAGIIDGSTNQSTRREAILILGHTEDPLAIEELERLLGN